MTQDTGNLSNVEPLIKRAAEIRRAFSPARPIAKRELFAGRVQQLLTLGDVLQEPGQHAVIYGERGVGKTSLAAVAEELYGDGRVHVRINCGASDTFSSLWRRTLGEIFFTQQGASLGFAPFPGSETHRGSEFLPVGEFSPDDLRLALRALTQLGPLLIFVDEFDRLSRDVRDIFADLFKSLSDHAVDATVVIVGVADNVDDLIVEHRSVERAVVQIDMPRMEPDELRLVVTKGLESVSLEADEDAIDQIVGLSQGLPHYTHLLAQEAGEATVWGRTDRITTAEVRKAINSALEKAQESVAEAYYKATSSNRSNMYSQVLLACALADRDERGFFAAASVREPLSELMGRELDIPAFANHLNAFSGDERGPILRKSGTQKKFRYRFVNPLMAPHVIMRGLADGMITAAKLHKLDQSAPLARGR